LHDEVSIWATAPYITGLQLHSYFCHPYSSSILPFYSTIPYLPGTGVNTIMDVIPVVDFSAFPHGSDEEKRQAALAIDDAFQNAGFVYLMNHGVSSDKVEECFEWVSHRSSIS
jgi:hypothetical protein